MPNWNSNVVEVRGPRKIVKELVDHKFDFQRIHPCPADLNITAGREGADDSVEQKALVAKEEANLKSPIAGIVDNVIVKPGQVVGQGVPLMTIVDPKDQWVVLNVTENNLNHFAVGSEFSGTVPALSVNNQPYRQVFKVYASSVLSDFATWRPTNSKDGFDMCTFEIRARPSQSDTRLRQGMTVLVDIPASQQPTQTQ